VANTAVNKLKIYPRHSAEPSRPTIEAIGSLPDVLRAFRQTTGWSLNYVAGPPPADSDELTWSAPVNPGVGVTLGHLEFDPAGPEPATAAKPVDEPTARTMASALGSVLEELLQTRHALWQREAELAAGVPVAPHPRQQEHLAERLEAVLKGGAEAVGCQAAALYLLDEGTSELKLRSSWGLPFDRLTAPARRLRGAVADLEALLGHAVVLRDTEIMQYWRVPEDFPSAVCIPVSSPTNIFGTLWVYCTEKRDFDDRQTNLLEIVAGRLAADLEREMLLQEGLETAGLKRQVADAQRLQRNQLPSISPLLDGWQLAGWNCQAEAVGGDFYDWFCLPDGLLAITVGHAMQRGIEAAMAAGALKASLRAHGQYHREAQAALNRLNLTMWTGSAGDQYATLFYGLVETATGRVCCASAGQPAVVLLRPDGWKSLSHQSPPLGESPETDYQQFGCELQPGEALVIFTDGFRDARDQDGRPLEEAGVAAALAGKRNLSAEQIVTLVRDRLDTHAADPDGHDRTVLAIKRTGT